MKRNGGILFIRYREGIKFLLFVILYLFSVVGSAQQLSIIYTTEEDSCLCVKFQQYLEEKEIGNLPEKMVSGMDKPLPELAKDINSYLLKEELKDSMSYVLIMQMVVDKMGYLRCANILKGKKDAISQKVFELYLQEKYIPASTRGIDLDYYFPFFLQKENNE